ncbi:unnamed protein product [Litomosoides sigmodontis]|uniref:Protein FMC1 homolog n=1 Tax=Litomosoides sigmodontis TaxID=42156 RepID=A0A3P6TUW5_LITSI|nr:unnamed protein product [Litomosoides sigmodontis]
MEFEILLLFSSYSPPATPLSDLIRKEDSMARWKNGVEAASLIRHVIEDSRKSGIDFAWKMSEVESMQKQKINIKQGKSGMLHNIPREEHLSTTYRHYLASTMRLKALQEQYKGGERSLEESAKLVGLKLPTSKS